jgi:hypothetical protein
VGKKSGTKDFQTQGLAYSLDEGNTGKILWYPIIKIATKRF